MEKGRRRRSKRKGWNGDESKKKKKHRSWRMWKSQRHLRQETRRCHTSNYIPRLHTTSPRLLKHYFQPAEERCHKKRERVGRTRESNEDDSEPRETRHSFRDDKVVLKAKEVESHHMRY